MLSCAWGALTDAQPRPYRVGVLTPGLGFQQALEGLREGLAALGYTEGHNLTFLVEDAQGEVASLPSRAARLVAAQPDLLFTISTAPAMAAKQATTTLPIVFTSVGDPLRAGLPCDRGTGIVTRPSTGWARTAAWASHHGASTRRLCTHRMIALSPTSSTHCRTS